MSKYGTIAVCAAKKLREENGPMPDPSLEDIR